MTIIWVPPSYTKAYFSAREDFSTNPNARCYWKLTIKYADNTVGTQTFSTVPIQVNLGGEPATYVWRATINDQLSVYQNDPEAKGNNDVIDFKGGNKITVQKIEVTCGSVKRTTTPNQEYLNMALDTANQIKVPNFEINQATTVVPSWATSVKYNGYAWIWYPNRPSGSGNFNAGGYCNTSTSVSATQSGNVWKFTAPTTWIRYLAKEEIDFWQIGQVGLTFDISIKGAEQYGWHLKSHYNGNAVSANQQTNPVVDVVAVLPDSIKPTLTIAVEDVNGYLEQYGSLVVGLSKVRVRATVTRYGTSPDTVAGKSVSAVLVGETRPSQACTDTATQTLTFVNSQNIQVAVGGVKVTLTDEFNRTQTIQQNITSAPYWSPSMTLSFKRTDTSNVESDTGTRGRVVITYDIAPLSNLNAKDLTVRYRDKSTSTWTTVRSGALSNYNGTYTYNIDGLSPDKSYELEAVLADNVNTVTRTSEIIAPYFLMDWYGNGFGIAFGKAAEQNGFDVGFDALFRNELVSGTDGTGTKLKHDVSATFVTKGKAQTGETDLTLEGLFGSIFKFKNLWTNASPTSNFDNQLVSLDLSPYEWILLIFRIGSGTGDTNGRFFTMLAKVNAATYRAQCNVGSTVYWRDFTVATATPFTSAGVDFTSRYSNAYVIPLEIYGLGGL